MLANSSARTSGAVSESGGERAAQSDSARGYGDAYGVRKRQNDKDEVTAKVETDDYTDRDDAETPKTATDG